MYGKKEEKSRGTQMLGGTGFLGVDPKKILPEYWGIPPFPIHFFDLVFGENVWEKGGEKVGIPKCWGVRVF
jgi:hypothetical protein